MLVTLAPPTVTDLLLHSAWFLALDSAAQQRVMDDVREVEVPQGGALCRRAPPPSTGMALSRGC